MKTVKLVLILSILMGFQAELSFAGCRNCGKSQAELEEMAGIDPSMTIETKLTKLLVLEYGELLERAGGNTDEGQQVFVNYLAKMLSNEGDEFISHLRRIYGSSMAAELPGYLLMSELADKIFEKIKDYSEEDDEFNPLNLDNGGNKPSFETSSVQNTTISSLSTVTAATTPAVEEM